MTKKPINITSIENELKGASLFFPSEDATKQATQGAEMAPDAMPVTTTVSSALPQKKAQAPKPQKADTTTPTPGLEPTKQPPFERQTERAVERTKVRHTFDIFKDQLSALRQIQVRREEVFGKRYLLGDLVQEALDMFITKQRNNE